MPSTNREHEGDTDPSIDDVDFESEDELGSVGALRAKLKKVKDELSAVKKERAEFLDGWQRAKAEMVNVRREALDQAQRASLNGKMAFLEDLLPAIDSFDMAMMGDGWKAVDPAWRVGVESIRSQIASALEAHGITSFGAPGETYDPMLHEAAQEIDGGAPGTIAHVLRKGFRTKDMVIRAAHVILYK